EMLMRDRIATVFGIRDDDPDLDGFLGTPVIEHVPVGEEIEDVLGAGDTDAVREVLSGDRATLPGMAEDDELLPDDPVEEPAEPSETEKRNVEPDESAEVGDEPELDAESDDGDEPEVDAPEPRAVDEGTAAVTAHEGGPIGTAATETDSEPEPAADEASEEPAEADETDVEEVLDDGAADEEPADETDEPATLPGEGGLAAALAAEIRSGAADEEDIETIEGAFEGGVPRSVDVRIARLQSSVADIEAY
ncbi:hypothetical protein DJ71_10290, partial [Halorubrum sp. E3]